MEKIQRVTADGKNSNVIQFAELAEDPGWGGATSRFPNLVIIGMGLLPASRFPCCVLLALSWNTNENPSTDKLSLGQSTICLLIW